MSAYRKMICEDLVRAGLAGANPAHVEACMRIEHPTLDSLSRARFRAEVAMAAECARQMGAAACAKLAWQMGCGPRAEGPQAEANDPSRKGTRASEIVEMHDCRFRVYAVHTRFDAVQWFAIDNRLLLIPNEPAVIAQCATFDECVAAVEARVASEIVARW